MAGLLASLPLLTLFLVSVVGAANAAARPAEPGGGCGEHTLCEALAGIEPGEKRPVEVSGVYGEGPESRVLYAVECSRNVQPVTWVEFTSHSTGLELLHRITKKDRRGVAVVLKGTLYGPGRSSAPSTVNGPGRLQTMPSTQRYGHLNGFRTKLVVTEVVSADTLPEGCDTSTVPFWSPPSTQIFPPVTMSEMPAYPEPARSLEIEGRVRVHLTIVDGVVADARVLDGHVALRAETLRVVKSWKFAKYVQGALETVFYFHLEQRSITENQNARVEMQLPSWVRVVAVLPTW